MTTVTIGDGRNTDFWKDTWLLDSPLADIMPALHSHAGGRVSSIHDVVRAGIVNTVQQRLSTQAAEELDHLCQLLLDVELTTSPDERHCCFEDSDHRLQSRLIYKVSMRGDQPCPAFDFVWRFAPPRIKFFGWVLTKDRIHCKTALRRKNILQDATCDICGAAEESGDHIFSGCPFAKSFWRRIGWPPSSVAHVTELWKSSPPIPLILLYCWELWKHRHDVVFRSLPPDQNRLVAACKATVRDWSCRLPVKDTTLRSFWSSLMNM